MEDSGATLQVHIPLNKHKTMQEPAQSVTTRREREREQHRDEILNAAEAVFSEKGIVSSTIEDIAKRAEFSVGSIYNFFAGKDDVIRNVFRRLLKEEITSIDEHVSPFLSEPVKALEQLTMVWGKHRSKHSDIMRAGETLRSTLGKSPGDPVEDKEIASMLHDIDMKIMAVFSKGVETGIFHKIKPELLTVMFYGICKSFCTYWKLLADTRPFEDRHRELFISIHYAVTGRPPEEVK